MAKLSEETKRDLKEVADYFDKEDRAVRERQIRLWKKLRYYWQGFERLWWSEVAHDWRVYDIETLGGDTTASEDAGFYDKPVNVFRAYLESIIAALSVTVPSIKCIPDDAENDADLETAKAGDKIAELIAKHNDVVLLWIKALYLYCTEGTVYAYNYPKEDEKYGTYTEPQYEDGEAEQNIPLCPLCGQQMPDPVLSNMERDEYMPDSDDAVVQNLLKEYNICPNCLEQVDPTYEKTKIIVERLVGVTTKPKTRQCIEAWGGLNVKVANYARCQAETPYLSYAYEENWTKAVEDFEEIRNDETLYKKVSSGSMYDAYERWGRLSTQYFGEYPINVVTRRYVWLRAWSFNILQDDRRRDALKDKFPNGAKVTFIGDEIVAYENEDLDDCWTITRNPLSDYMTHDPLGLLLTSVQEITENIISLVLQTIEHGIGQTFADPAVLDFDAYGQTEVAPGAVYPVKQGTGKNIGDAFFQTKTATLSGEVLPFAEKVQELGQMVSGALPSLFGGAAPNSSKTAAQYAMSRAQALQRLQTPWKMFTIWWKTIFGKVIPSFIECMVEDERFVKETTPGQFINVLIKKAQLQGKIGDIELEASEELPVSWGQQKDLIMQLLQSGLPEIMQTFAMPENAYLIKEVLGINDLYIPGEDDREKQYEEISNLLNSSPLMGPQGPAPSVDIEPLIDNNQIHAEICKSWLVSERGRLAKIENPQGYQNIMLHMQHHMNAAQAMMAMQQGPPPPQPQPQPPSNGNKPASKPNGKMAQMSAPQGVNSNAAQ